MRPHTIIMLAVMMVAVVVFAPTGNAAAKVRSAKASAPLNVVVTAVPQPGHCAMEVTATNTQKHSVSLKFNTSQHYDFYAKDENQRIIWKWSDGRVFADAQSVQTLKPGDQLRHKVQWNYTRNDGYKVKAGKFKIMGAVTSQPQNKYSVPVEIVVTQEDLGRVGIRGRISDLGARVYLLASDGVAYQIDPGDSFRPLNGKQIVADDYDVAPIPGTVDRTIVIRSYHEIEG